MILFLITIKLLFALLTIIYALKALGIFGIHNVLEVIFDAIETLGINEIAISKHQVNLMFVVRGTSIRHNNNITYRRNVMIKGSGTCWLFMLLRTRMFRGEGIVLQSDWL